MSGMSKPSSTTPLFYVAPSGDVDTVTAFLSSITDAAVSVTLDSTTLVVTVPKATKDFLAVITDLEGCDVKMEKAHETRLTGATLVEVHDALRAYGHDSKLASVLGVNADGTIWTTDAGLGPLVVQSVQDLRGKISEEANKDAAADPPQNAEHMLIMKGDLILSPAPTAVPDTWIKFFVDNLRKSKNASQYDFNGGVSVEAVGKSITVTAHFKTQNGRDNFASLLRNEAPWQLAIEKGTVARFVWTYDPSGNKDDPLTRVTRYIATIDNITEGVMDGDAMAVNGAVEGDVALLTGPTQAGKSTTISNATGRTMIISNTASGMSVVEGLNPLAQFTESLQNKYSIVKRRTPDAPSIKKEWLADRLLDKELRGVALPEGYEIINPLYKKNLDEKHYEVVPEADWLTIPDLLAVAKEKLGHSTTKDIYAYPVEGATFTIVLDTPGTHDTSGLKTDIRNTIVRHKTLQQCTGVRLCIVVDFSLLSTAGGQQLGEFLAPVGCMLKDFKGSLASATVLFTRMTHASNLATSVTPGEATVTFTDELRKWTSSLIGQIKGMASGPVMRDQYAGPLLEYAVKELETTLLRLNSGTGSWGKACIVHPLLEPGACLLPVMSAAAPLPPSAFRASLGPKGSASLGQCLEFRRRQFAHALNSGDEARAVVFAADMYRALLELKRREIHFTMEDAKLDVVEDEMKALITTRRATKVNALHAAIKSIDADAVEKVLDSLRKADAALETALKPYSTETQALVCERLGIGRHEHFADDEARTAAATLLPTIQATTEIREAFAGHSLNGCREAQSSLLALHRIVTVCSQGGRETIHDLIDGMVQCHKREVTALTEAVSGRFAFDPLLLRQQLVQLDRATTMAFNTVKTASVEPLSAVTIKATHVEALNATYKALQAKSARIAAALKGTTTTMVNDPSHDCPAANEPSGECLSKAAAALFAVCHDKDVLEQFKPIVNESDYIAQLHAPWAKEVAALALDPFKGVNIKDPVTLATRTFPVLQSKVRAICAFSQTEDDASVLGTISRSVLTLAEKAHEVCLATIKNPSSLAEGNGSSPVTSPLHTLVVCYAMAAVVVDSAKDGEGSLNAISTLLDGVWTAWATAHAEAFARAKQSSRTSLHDMVLHRQRLLNAQSCIRDAVVYGCSTVLDVIAKRHDAALAAFAKDVADLDAELLDRVNRMSVDGAYKDIDTGLTQLDEILASKCMSDVITARAVEKRDALLSWIKERHDELCTSIYGEPGSPAPSFETIFTQLVGGGIKLRASGILAQYNSVRSQAQLIDVTLELQDFGEKLCDVTRQKPTAATVRTCQTVLSILRGALMPTKDATLKEALEKCKETLERACTELNKRLDGRRDDFLKRVMEKADTNVSFISLRRQMTDLGDEAAEEAADVLRDNFESTSNMARQDVRSLFRPSGSGALNMTYLTRALSIANVLDWHDSQKEGESGVKKYLAKLIANVQEDVAAAVAKASSRVRSGDYAFGVRVCLALSTLEAELPRPLVSEELNLDSRSLSRSIKEGIEEEAKLLNSEIDAAPSRAVLKTLGSKVQVFQEELIGECCKQLIVRFTGRQPSVAFNEREALLLQKEGVEVKECQLRGSLTGAIQKSTGDIKNAATYFDEAANTWTAAIVPMAASTASSWAKQLPPVVTGTTLLNSRFIKPLALLQALANAVVTVGVDGEAIQSLANAADNAVALLIKDLPFNDLTTVDSDVELLLLLLKFESAGSRQVREKASKVREAAVVSIRRIIQRATSVLGRLSVDGWQSISVEECKAVEWLTALEPHREHLTSTFHVALPKDTDSKIEQSLRRLIPEAKIDLAHARGILNALAPLVSASNMDKGRANLDALKTTKDKEAATLRGFRDTIKLFDSRPEEWKPDTGKSLVNDLYNRPTADDGDSSPAVFTDEAQREALRHELSEAAGMAAKRLNDVVSHIGDDITSFDPLFIRDTVAHLLELRTAMDKRRGFDAFEAAARIGQQALHKAVRALLSHAFLIRSDERIDVDLLELRNSLVDKLQIDSAKEVITNERADTAEVLWKTVHRFAGLDCCCLTAHQLDCLDAAVRAVDTLGVASVAQGWKRSDVTASIDAAVQEATVAFEAGRYDEYVAIASRCGVGSIVTLRLAEHLNCHVTTVTLALSTNETLFESVEGLVPVHQRLPGGTTPDTLSSLTKSVFESAAIALAVLSDQLKQGLLQTAGTAAGTIEWLCHGAKTMRELAAAPSTVAALVQGELIARFTEAMIDTTTKLMLLAGHLRDGLSHTVDCQVQEVSTALTEIIGWTRDAAMTAAIAKLKLDVVALNTAANELQRIACSVTSARYLHPSEAFKRAQLLLPFGVTLKASTHADIVHAGSAIIESVVGSITSQCTEVVNDWKSLKAGDSVGANRITQRFGFVEIGVAEVVKSLSATEKAAVQKAFVEMDAALKRSIHSKIAAAMQNITSKDSDVVVAKLIATYKAIHQCAFIKSRSGEAFNKCISDFLQNDNTLRAVVYRKLDRYRNTGGHWLRDRQVFRVDQQRERSSNTSISAEKAVKERMQFEPTLANLEPLIERTRRAMTDKLQHLLTEADNFADYQQLLDHLPAKLAAAGFAAAQDQSSDSLFDLLCLVCFAFTWLHSGADYVMAKSIDVLKRPNAVQMAVLLRMLKLDVPSKDSDITTRMARLASQLSSRDMFPGHAAEIPTGQGKSIVLGILACVLALLGRYVDVVCFSHQLTLRDAADMKPLFDLANVSDRISYLTFQGIMDRRVGGLREAVLSEFKTSVRPHAASVEDSCPERRVMLLDELDMLFDPQFYGELYHPTARYGSASVHALLKHIYDSRNDFEALRAIPNHPTLQAVIDENPSLKDYILDQLPAMCAQVRDIGAATDTFMSPYDYVVDREQGIGYHDSDGAINFRSALHGWYRAAFAMLRELEAGRVVADLHLRISLPLQLPGFAYSDLPRECYCAVMGATGTLKQLVTRERQTQTQQRIELETLCNIKLFTFAQDAIDDEQRREVQRQVWVVGDSIMVDPEANSEVEWRRAIRRAIEEVPRSNGVEPGDTSKALPVVVIFENLWQIKLFEEEFKADHQVIDRNTPPAMVARLIESATDGNTVTLIDRVFGRGTDFKCKQCDLLTVIQTYLPLSVSEEIQLGGRTARNGEPGKLKVVLCPSHVVAKLQALETNLDLNEVYVKQSWSLSEQSKRHAFQPLREQREEQAMNAKRSQQQVTAATSNLPSKDFMKRVMDKAPNTREIIIESLPRRVKRDLPIIFLLDASHSMESPVEELPKYATIRAWAGLGYRFLCRLGVKEKRQRWNALQQAFGSVLTSIRLQSPDTHVAVIVFGRKDEARVLASAPANQLEGSLLSDVKPELGTEYFAAFDTAKTCVQQTPQAFKGKPVRVIFLTDGEDEPNEKRDVSTAIDALCNAVTIAECVTLAIEMDSSARSLTHVASCFRRHRVAASTQEVQGQEISLSAALSETCGMLA